MNKHESTSFMLDWYSWWLTQQQLFHQLSEQHLKSLFKNNDYNFEDSKQTIALWLDALKNEYHKQSFPWLEENYADYARLMQSIGAAAFDLLMQEWQRSAREKQQISSIQELYQCWLNCCHKIYQEKMQEVPQQEMFGKMMQTSLKFWQQFSQK